MKVIYFLFVSKRNTQVAVYRFRHVIRVFKATEFALVTVIGTYKQGGEAGVEEACPAPPRPAPPSPTPH